jgi:hypothetical protein
MILLKYFLLFEDLQMLSAFWYNSRDYRGNAETSDCNNVGKLSFWIMRRSNNRQDESSSQKDLSYVQLRERETLRKSSNVKKVE